MFDYLALSLFGVTALYGAILVPLVLAAMLLWERCRVRRAKDATAEDAPVETTSSAVDEVGTRQSAPPRHLGWHDVGVGSAVSLAVIPTLSVAGHWLFPFYGAALMTFTSIPCLVFWLKLRKSNVRGAEVYALSAWTLAYAAWLGGLIAVDILGLDPRDARWAEEGFQPAIGVLHFASVAYAIVGSAVAMRFVRRRPGSSIPMIVLLGWMPLGIAVWSATPWSAAHLALAVMLTGYAIARDVRRTLDGGMPESGESIKHSVFRVLSSRDRVGTIAFAVLGVVILSAFAVVGTWAFLGVTDMPALGDDGSAQSLWFWYAQVVPVAALALVAGVVAWLKGALFRYGAMLIGIGWPLILSLALMPHHQFTEAGPDLVGWIPVPFVTLLVLYVMWRVFRPGVWVDGGHSRSEVMP